MSENRSLNFSKNRSDFRSSHVDNGGMYKKVEKGVEKAKFDKNTSNKNENDSNK